MITVADVKKYYEELDCWKHPTEVDWSQVVSVEAWEASVPDGDTGYALCRMVDRRWLVLSESQDYSGHG